MLSRVIKKDLGLKSRGGEGRQLAAWYRWWKLEREGNSVPKIAAISDEAQSDPRHYDERTIRYGIQQVERLMTPVEKPSDI